MGIISGGNGRVKCDSCGRESGENDMTLKGFIQIIDFDQDGVETDMKTLCLTCAMEDEE